MSNHRGYDLVWKKGSWFEKGHFQLIPKQSFGDKVGGMLLGYILILAVIALILSLVIITLPFWTVIIGFQMVREKRYYTGILSLLALGYFYLDIQKQWITSFMFFGYTNSDGTLATSFLDIEKLKYFEMINLIGAGLGIGYIIDAILISKYGRKHNDNTITTSQVVCYLVPIFFAFVYTSKNNSKYNQSILQPTQVQNFTEKEESIVVDSAIVSKIKEPIDEKVLTSFDILKEYLKNTALKNNNIINEDETGDLKIKNNDDITLSYYYFSDAKSFSGDINNDGISENIVVISNEGGGGGGNISIEENYLIIGNTPQLLGDLKNPPETEYGFGYSIVGIENGYLKINFIHRNENDGFYAQGYEEILRCKLVNNNIYIEN